MRDRIKKIMESQHMTQQVFAKFIHIAPATLSSIFTGRTDPTLKIVEAIKNKLPDISTDWLMFGNGQMYVGSSDGEQENPEGHHEPVSDMMLQFEDSPAPPRSQVNTSPVQAVVSASSSQRQAKTVGKEFYRSPRQITEIRVFYDDQTWETFVPRK